MQIDWITIIAQAANFLILVWLLKRFLYRPVMDAVSGREEKISQRLRDAETSKCEAEAEARKLRAMRQELDHQKQVLIAEAKEETLRLRHALEMEARQEIEEQRNIWRRQIDDERMTFVNELRRHSIENFYNFARQALRGLANRTLNDAIADAFIEQLAHLDEAVLGKLRDRTANPQTVLHVEAGQELSADVKTRIATAIQQTFSIEKPVEFRIAEDLICGVRLNADGQTLGWNLAGYLDRLEERAISKMAALSVPQEQGDGTSALS